MLGIFFSIIAGAAMSLQGVINTRLSEKIGLYESNLFVQGIAFLLSIVAMFLLGKGNFTALPSVNKIYLFGGVLGLIITITVMLSIKDLNPTIAISIILIAQLIVAALIEAFGLLGTKKLIVGWTHVLGVIFMIIGVLIFKLNLNK